MINFQQFQDIRQTIEYAHFMEKIGWKVERIKSTSEVKEKKTINVFIKKLPLFPFSILKILRYHPPLNQKELDKLIQQYHVFLVKLQPFALENYKLPTRLPAPPASGAADGGQVTNYRLQIDGSPLIPTKTIWFDLTQTEQQILKQMKPKTRYNLRLAQRNNLKVNIISGDKISAQQLTEFYRLWSKNKPFNFLFKPSFYELKSLVESFGQRCFFIFVYKGFPLLEQGKTLKELLAACLVLTSKNMAAYWYNFSTPEGKKLFAPTLYVWGAIKEAKRRKLKVFDFEGVWDERIPRLNRGWQGFSRFKESFGGEIIQFAWPQESFRFF